MRRVLIIILNYKTYEMTIDLVKQAKGPDESLFSLYFINNRKNSV